MAEIITKIEFIRNTVQPVIIVDSGVTEQVSAIVYINTVVQAVIEIDTQVTEQVSAVEYVDVIVQPVIEIDSDVTEQSSSIVYINNTVQPTIVVDSNIIETITRAVYDLEQLSTIPSSVDYNVDDLGYLDSFLTGPKSTIEEALGVIENYSLGTIFSINKGYIERIQTDTPTFTLTVSQGDGLNYSAVLSAMQTQETQYYDEMIADNVVDETIFKVSDGLGDAYYKILFVNNRKKYYEIIDAMI